MVSLCLCDGDKESQPGGLNIPAPSSEGRSSTGGFTAVNIKGGEMGDYKKLIGEIDEDRCE